MPELAYLDHAATSPLRAEVAEAMAAVAAEGLGNPTGAHRLARAARRRLDDAREEIAGVLGCRPGEVVLTSGGTEADNLALLGRTAADGVGAASLCAATEHHAVLDVATTVVPVDRGGAVDRQRLAAALDELGAGVAVVIDGGVCAGEPSTVVSCIDGVRIIRQGAIPGADIVRT